MTDISHRDIDADGHRLRVLQAGSPDNPPVLLVPGITMSAARWVEAGYIDGLRERWHVLAVDPLGHGESDHCDDVEQYRVDRLVAHLVSVLDGCDIDAAVAWGYSRGAVMAEQLSHAHPERVRSLVYGGNVLFDGHAVLESLGMLPDPADVAAGHERAMAGDWSGFWDHFPIPIGEATRRDIESRNHLPSIAAAAQAGREDRPVWRKPSDVASFAYWGDQEIFAGLNKEAAENDSLPHAEIPGDHPSAFDPAGNALAVVERFLTG